MIASAIALLILQVGPNPGANAFPGLPEELRDRPPRERAAAPVVASAQKDVHKTVGKSLGYV